MLCWLHIPHCWKSHLVAHLIVPSLLCNQLALEERADCFNFFQIHSSVKGLYALKTSFISLKWHGFVCDCGMSSFFDICILCQGRHSKDHAIWSESCSYQDAGVYSTADDWPKSPLLKDLTGQIGATSSDIYQNVRLYVQLQNPVDDIVADEY